MVICEPYKFIFVHVYRTGGSSVDRAFGQWALPTEQTHKQLEEVSNWEDYFSFGFVRNPWDRMVSSYMFKETKKQNTKSFQEVVRGLIPGRKEYAQHKMLKNCTFVGRFEHLHEDLAEACKLIGIDTPALPHIWKTNHKHYSSYYVDDEMKEALYKHQSGDIDHYGFSFDSAATKNFGLQK